MRSTLRNLSQQQQQQQRPGGSRLVVLRRRGLVKVAAASGQQQPGGSIEQWLRTPFDIAAFGPRAALGALVSLPERLQMMETDVARVVDLVQSPRPPDEKAGLALREAETVLLELLQRGAGVETDALATLKAALPSELAAALDAAVPPLPDAGTSGGSGTGSSSGSSGGGSGGFGGGAAYDAGGASSTATATTAATAASSLADSQAAAEVAEIRTAVAGVKSSLEELRANSDASRSGLLRLNLREARDMLARRLREATLPGSGEAAGSLAAARREANVLLEEVDGQFFSGSSSGSSSSS